MTTGVEVALSYQEPDIKTILIFTSFILLLNVVNYVLDRLIYVGLIGQVLLGVIWGTPVAQWLGNYVEATVVDLGFLGLLLLIFEGAFLREILVYYIDYRIGGLCTSYKSLKANLWLSLFVALTGVCLPIGLSFVLIVLTSATPLQAFAAGASLCSTSLGTTFTVMQASSLTATRMGVMLSSAAMIDDIIGKKVVSMICVW